MKTLSNDEQVIFNETFITMNHPVAGEVKVLGHANRYDGKPLAAAQAATRFGREHLGAAQRVRLLGRKNSGYAQIRESCSKGGIIPYSAKKIYFNRRRRKK